MSRRRPASRIDGQAQRKNLDGILLLSIQGLHAERIWAGIKTYELRRVLPRFPFSRVFLYQTEGVGFIGCFDVGSLHEMPVQLLWRFVGTAATSKERFERYFAGSPRGFAIGVDKPLRFRRPLTLDALRRRCRAFYPPQSAVWLKVTHPVARYLAAKRRDAVARQRKRQSVSLRPIGPTERAAYVDLVTKEVANHYEGIDHKFAAFNLDVHDAGADSWGMFTRSKTVLTICGSRRGAIGFTTLTWKRGGSVKTGPTILFPSYRHLGYGQAVRLEIERDVVRHGGRKIYCTAAAVARDVIAYLIRASMRLEAHLEKHYAGSHDELVFGKVLARARRVKSPALQRSEQYGLVSDPRTLAGPALVRACEKMFAGTWRMTGTSFMAGVVRSALEHSGSTPKPRTLLVAVSGRRCIAAIILVPKRGGAVKALLLSATSDLKTLIALIKAAEHIARVEARRKVYFLQPREDHVAVSAIQTAGYQSEGLIREPYAVGQDVFVLAKMLA